jgi:PD-(D/E)XK endonuclease
MELSTDQKGALAELSIARDAIALGIGVYAPLGDGERYDLIFDLGERLERIQCKWAALDGDVLVVRCQRCRRTSDGFLRRGYTEDDVDAIAAYCRELDRCFYFPVKWLGRRRNIQLRLCPARNGQRKRINWADDFSLERLGFAVRGP